MLLERASTFALKIPYVATFRQMFEKAIVRLDFSTFNLSKCNISCKKYFFKCRNKIVSFGYFWAGTRNTRFQTKRKILEFMTRIVLIVYFRLDLQKSMSNLKPASSNLLTCKVSSKNKKTLDLGPKHFV